MYCGTSGAPTLLLGVPSTFTVLFSEPMCTSYTSSVRTSREGFTLVPSNFTLPALQASVANERVLKRRTIQSHLSILTSSFSIRYPIFFHFIVRPNAGTPM